MRTIPYGQRTTVYRAFDRHNRLLYVGRTWGFHGDPRYFAPGYQQVPYRRSVGAIA